MKQKEEKWINEAVQGSNRAFAKLVKIYTGMIFKLTYNMTGNLEDAKDITQETFTRAFINISSFNRKSKFSTWLYRIAYNKSVDLLRKKSRINTGLDESKFNIPENSSKKFYTGKQDAIEKALGTLTQNQKTAVVLYYYHNCSLKEIAEVLGCAHSTARVHLFRGLKKLKKELKDFK
ncbi:sigma-70 family RNA polymerase sigma factor [bacterium]|nr:sigma-70 family RNA polymerase sigma factor [bacterium]